MKVESKAGLLRGAASQAVEVGGAERTLIIGAVSQPGRTVASQLGHVYRHIDGVLEQHGMERNNVVSWECVCDPQGGRRGLLRRGDARDGALLPRLRGQTRRRQRLLRQTPGRPPHPGQHARHGVGAGRPRPPRRSPRPSLPFARTPSLPFAPSVIPIPFRHSRSPLPSSPPPSVIPVPPFVIPAKAGISPRFGRGGRRASRPYPHPHPLTAPPPPGSVPQPLAARRAQTPSRSISARSLLGLPVARNVEPRRQAPPRRRGFHLAAPGVLE